MVRPILKHTNVSIRLCLKFNIFVPSHQVYTRPQARQPTNRTVVKPEVEKHIEKNGCDQMLASRHENKDDQKSCWCLPPTRIAALFNVIPAIFGICELYALDTEHASC